MSRRSIWLGIGTSRWLSASSGQPKRLSDCWRPSREWAKITQYQSPLLAGMRMFALKRFPNHLVFYLPRKNGLEVVTVLQGARDIESLL
jgi:hypothetical protein